VDAVLGVSLDGRIAVVTGAGRGLGAAAARSLAEAGADLALLARNKAELDAVAADVEAHGRQALPIVVDVTDEAAVEAAADHVVSIFGRADVLVNNAGFAPVGPLLELDLGELRRVFEVNVFGTSPARAPSARTWWPSARARSSTSPPSRPSGGTPI
jgi:NAD(P)-dependent dehydrogenase (short-subunit alcohol dehydrogenase family)